MSRSIRASRAALATIAVGVITGCSSMQPTPIMPTQPARIGGRDGVTLEQDAACRQQAYQAAQAAKESNVTTEVATTAVSAIAGAVIGHAISPHGGGPRGPGPGGPGPRGPSGPNLAGAGAATGALAGAAASQGMLQDTQQVYDINYNNCVAAYANSNAATYTNTKRRK
jgi:hypothetical protein